MSYTFHYFSDVGGVDVTTHYGEAGARLLGDVDLSVQWGHDIVVFPAIDAPPGSQDAVDAITTASRPIAGVSDAYKDFVKTRNEVQGFIGYGGFKAGYYTSVESDYYAQMVSANYNHDILHDNLNISVGSSYGWDHITPLADFDTDGIPDYRETWHGNIIATQIVSPTTVVRVGAEYNRIRGLQHDPYRNVYVAGTNVPERHPKYRDRRDAFIRVSQYINNRSSIKVDYRYYEDDWGVSSHTVGARLSQYVTDQIVVRYRYRYYSQAPAFFYRDEYTLSGGIDGFQTGDYRLGDYSANLFGGRIMWFPYGAVDRIGFVRGMHVVFSYERYFNSSNFSANIFETGLRFSF